MKNNLRLFMKFLRNSFLTPIHADVTQIHADFTPTLIHKCGGLSTRQSAIVLRWICENLLFLILFRSLFIFIFIFLLSNLSSPQLNAKEDFDFLETKATISMDFQDANLKDILKIFSIQSGLNFIASEGVQDRKITLYLDNVPIEEAMNKLFKANNLYYELDKDSNVFIVKDLGKPEIETITKVFYLKYATVSSSPLRGEISAQIGSATGAPSEAAAATAGPGSTTTGTSVGAGGITEAVKKILSMYGSVIEDFRTNSLIVTDIPSRMPIIAQTIASLDMPVAQVMLEVEMLDVSKNTVDRLGFEFGNNPFTLIMPGEWMKRGMEFYIGAKIDRNREGGVTLGRTYAHLLDFLRTQTDTKYLARPRLLTLNNETAEIKITTQESVGIKTTTEDTSGTTTAEPERVETGVSLRVTPQISMPTGEITMFIYPQVSEAIQGNILTSGDKTYRYRDPEVRNTKSVVRVKDGETIIIGGLIRNELQQTITKLPILGDIPILGALFRHKNKTKDQERELLVFITPHIIKDTKMEVTPTKKVALPEREQSAGSAYERRLNISSSLDNFEKMMK